MVSTMSFQWQRSLDDFLADVKSHKTADISHYETFFLPSAAERAEFAPRLGQTLLDLGHTCTVHTLQLRVSDLLATATSVSSSPSSPSYPMLSYLHSNPTSLKHFDLRCNNIPSSYLIRLGDIPGAIAACQDVTTLTLNGVSPESIDVVKLILDKLATRRLAANSSAAGIQTLGLGFDVEDNTAETCTATLHYLLPPFFQSCATNLPKLHLTRLQVDQESCQLLLKTWQSSFAYRPEAIVFSNCSFNREASVLFGKLMQSETIQSGSKDNDNCNNTNSGKILDVYMEPQPDGAVCQWQVDEHDLAPCLPSFFLQPRCARIRVRDFQTTWDSIWNLHVVAAYLPSSVYMRKLEIYPSEQFEDETYEERWRRRHRRPGHRALPAASVGSSFQGPRPLSPRQVLNAIRRNGSLHDFVLFNNGRFFTRRMKRHLKAYLTRNRQLPRLLSRPRLDSTDMAGSHDASRCRPTDLKFFPSLFLCAGTAPTMATHNILMGLSAVSATTSGELCLGPKAESVAVPAITASSCVNTTDSLSKLSLSQVEGQTSMHNAKPDQTTEGDFDYPSEHTVVTTTDTWTSASYASTFDCGDDHDDVMAVEKPVATSPSVSSRKHFPDDDIANGDFATLTGCMLS